MVVVSIVFEVRLFGFKSQFRYFLVRGEVLSFLRRGDLQKLFYNGTVGRRSLWFTEVFSIEQCLYFSGIVIQSFVFVRGGSIEILVSSRRIQVFRLFTFFCGILRKFVNFLFLDYNSLVSLLILNRRKGNIEVYSVRFLYGFFIVNVLRFRNVFQDLQCF